MNRVVEQWDTFEIVLKGPSSGNPFTEVELAARFTHEQSNTTLQADGFYDGQGTYRVRFMPTEQGTWQYETKSNRKELDAQRGSFTASKPGPNNHGPVRVFNTFHFQYGDGTPYRQIGTTCYAWIHQDEQLEEQTL